VALLAGCGQPTTQRYTFDVGNQMLLRDVGVKGIVVGPSAGPPTFDPQCRGYGRLLVAGGLTHVEYIREALRTELRRAGGLAEDAGLVMLEGRVDRLEFSSMRQLTGGNWTIGLSLVSSNGSSLSVIESYDFIAGFSADVACWSMAQAFATVVQRLIGSVVGDPGFRQLLFTAAPSPAAPPRRAPAAPSRPTGRSRSRRCRARRSTTA
jgi:hypothetical protein